MRTLALWLAGLLIITGCTAAIREERGGILIESWPAIARRAETPPPPGFVDELVLGGLSQPTALRFLPDGRLLVIEQRGVVLLVTPNGDEPTQQLVDLRDQVFNRAQQGLLGLAVDPEFEDEPYVYLAYTYDAPPGGQAPTYGSPGVDLDECADGRSECPASARLARFRMLDGQGFGPQQVLIEDWCISGPNHTVGTIAFGSDGALWAGAGDGADGRDLDHGQLTDPPNACADPQGEGGALRSQDLLVGTDPVGLAGTIIRVDRATGEALPDNPLAASADANARRIVAHGLRNPFRFTFHPTTDDLWVADVGWRNHDELNRIPDPLAAGPHNLGWPCFEGPFRQAEYGALEAAACAGLYADDGVGLIFPHISLARDRSTDGSCPGPASAISALAFYDGAAFPEEYGGALFFGDTPRECMWVMMPGVDGLPDPASAREFIVGVAPVDMRVGPDGALYYVDVRSGEVRRIRYDGAAGGAP